MPRIVWQGLNSLSVCRHPPEFLERQVVHIYKLDFLRAVEGLGHDCVGDLERPTEVHLQRWLSLFHVVITVYGWSAFGVFQEGSAKMVAVISVVSAI